MKKMIIIKVFLLLTLFITNIAAEEIKIRPQDAVIIISYNANFKTNLAAQELQKHLTLIGGEKVPIFVQNQKNIDKYCFFVGILPFNNKNKLAMEEACRIVTKRSTYLYGGESYGTLFAVYNFLEDNFGVRWVEPGDNGICFKEQNPLSLKIGRANWIPQLAMRNVRSGMGHNWQYHKLIASELPEDFKMSQNEYERKKVAIDLWLKRMRMGGRIALNYGHAFTNWWGKYRYEHPEYFAFIKKTGKREPYSVGGNPVTIKLCVSNPAVTKQVVDNWLNKRTPTINVCENDNDGFCECTKCLALDAREKGEKFTDHLTDRYIYFANMVLKEAHKKVPDAKAVMYAYSFYRFPPRKQRVEDGLIIGFVPSMLNLEKAETYYKGWIAKGAREIFLRPNDQHINTGLPMGFEKQLFESFQLGIKYGIIGVDYDALHNLWPITGIADYILARAICYPSKSFQHWEDEYYTTFGVAKEDIKAFFHYWRKNIWEKRIIPKKEYILKVGQYGNFRRGLLRDLVNFYKESDFDITDSFLKKASGKNLTPKERKRLNQLILANHHSRLVYHAIKTKSVNEKLKATNDLFNFRQKHKNDLNINWDTLARVEINLGDFTENRQASKFKNFDYYYPFPLYWRFKIDPQNTGQKEMWQNYSWDQICVLWDLVQTNTPWERLKYRTPQKLINRLKKYDGIGWYAQSIKVDKKLKDKKIYLYFGAVDESCWIYVNKKLVGTHIMKKLDDWKTPFKINITKAIDWNKDSQFIMVRVEDKLGDGGIWKPVYIVVE